MKAFFHPGRHIGPHNVDPVANLYWGVFNMGHCLTFIVIRGQCGEFPFLEKEFPPPEANKYKTKLNIINFVFYEIASTVNILSFFPFIIPHTLCLLYSDGSNSSYSKSTRDSYILRNIFFHTETLSLERLLGQI